MPKMAAGARAIQPPAHAQRANAHSSGGCLQGFRPSGALPGLAHLRPGRPRAHRMFWVLMMVLLATLWCILAENQLNRWLRAPVIVAMAPSPHVITDLPMPAVTICPSTANVDARRFNTTLAAERQLGRRPPLTQREGAPPPAEGWSWTPDAGFAAGAAGPGFPARVRGPGAGLSAAYRVDFQLLGAACAEGRRSVQVQLHSPATVASLGQATVPATPEEEVTLALTPHMVITSPALRRYYTPSQRQCYFQDERPLRFFGLYTQSNCELECLSNVTLRLCGCVPFYYPYGLEAPICPHRDWNCLTEAQARVSGAAVQRACDCLATCMQLTFSAEVSRERLPPGGGPLEGFVIIYFPKRYFSPYQRTEVFGIVDLVANLGGLLGLCLGMSLVSVAELLFWLVQLVRYICPLRPFPRLGLRRMWGGACNSIFADCV